MIKVLVVVLVLGVAAVITMPLWASCKLQSQACGQWCGVKHFNADIKAAACRAECVAEKLVCLAEEGGVGR